jgi:hypothetical protein
VDIVPEMEGFSRKIRYLGRNSFVLTLFQGQTKKDFRGLTGNFIGRDCTSDMWLKSQDLFGINFSREVCYFEGSPDVSRGGGTDSNVGSDCASPTR